MITKIESNFFHLLCWRYFVFLFHVIYEYATLIPPCIKKVTKSNEREEQANTAAAMGEEKRKKVTKTKVGEP